METIKVLLQNGTQYEIDQDGCFLRYNEHKWKHPHDSWKCCGVSERLAFNNMNNYTLQHFIALIRAGKIVTFKNGAAKFYLRDIDHGTHRLQGNGIAHVTLS
ncbi:hypothetical protein LCGC14_0579960 [marine sediment metagenome]|uniref:Uncharacterized protein n=1 Tax=marine sediment metagenome TaxID=412755 RepID=A0A0F9RLS4_9ZZZZ